MVNPKDRRPEYPGRVRLTPVEGQSGVYDMERADQPSTPGTPLNRATLQLLQGDIREFPASETGDEIEEGASVTVFADGVSTTYISGVQPIEPKLTPDGVESAYSDANCAFPLTENLAVIGYSYNSSVVWRIFDSTTGQVVGHTSSSIPVSGFGNIGCRIDDAHFLIATHTYDGNASGYIAVVEYQENAAYTGNTKVVSGRSFGSNMYPLSITFLTEDRIVVGASSPSAATGHNYIFSIGENYTLGFVGTVSMTGTSYAISGNMFRLSDKENGTQRYAAVYKNGVGAVISSSGDSWDSAVAEMYWSSSESNMRPLFQLDDTTIVFGAITHNVASFYKAMYTENGVNVEKIGSASDGLFKYARSDTGVGSMGPRSWYFVNADKDVVTVRGTDAGEVVVTKTSVTGVGSWALVANGAVCIMPDQSGFFAAQVYNSSNKTYKSCIWRGALRRGVFAPTTSTSGTHAIALNAAAPGETVRCLFSGVADAEWARSGWKLDTDGVRGYSPADGFVAAQPYWWNVDDPATISAQQAITTAELDCIETQQAITDAELDDIAANQLYTDLELGGIEQGQTQTDLELMILGG